MQAFIHREGKETEHRLLIRLTSALFVQLAVSGVRDDDEKRVARRALATLHTSFD